MADPVDVFRRIVGLIFKWFLISTLIVIGVGAILGGIAYGFNWFNYDRHLQNVSFEVNTNRDFCKEEKFPIFVRVMNDSSRTIERFSFTLEAKVKGRSTDLARYHSYNDDHITPPKSGISNCWSVPELTQSIANPRDLDWSINYKSVTFRD
jgi:hypothetical protein